MAKAKGKAKGNSFEDRFVRREHVPPDKLLENPDNFRIHSELQKKYLSGSLEELGWVGEIRANINTRCIIDGHLRLAMAKERGEATVPVNWYDVSKEDERKALAVHDRIAAMAGEDQGKLTALLGKLDLSAPTPLQPMLQELSVDLKPLETPPLDPLPSSDPGPEPGTAADNTISKSADSGGSGDEIKTKNVPIMFGLSPDEHKAWKALRGDRSNKQFALDLIERGAAALEE